MTEHVADFAERSPLSQHSGRQAVAKLVHAAMALTFEKIFLDMLGIPIRL